MSFRYLIAAALIIISGTVIGASRSAGGEGYEELIDRAEELWMQEDYDACEEVTDRLIELYPDRADPYWRKARAVFYQYEDLPRDKKPEKEKLVSAYRHIEELSRICMEKEPDNGCCYMWMAAGLGRRGTEEGMVSLMGMGDDLEMYLLKGIELKPAYRSADGSQNTLGDLYIMAAQFYRIVPEWACVFPLKNIAGTCGDLDKALEFSSKALELEASDIEYNKELGLALVCYGQRREKPEKIDEGMKYLKLAVGLPALMPTDEIDREHAKTLIENPDLCCGYSRDKQQKQSREELMEK